MSYRSALFLAVEWFILWTVMDAIRYKVRGRPIDWEINSFGALAAGAGYVMAVWDSAKIIHALTAATKGM